MAKRLVRIGKTSTRNRPASSESEFRVRGPNSESERDAGRRLVLAAKRIGGVAELSRKTEIPRRSLDNYAGGVQMPANRMESISRATGASSRWLAGGAPESLIDWMLEIQRLEEIVAEIEKNPTAGGDGSRLEDFRIGLQNAKRRRNEFAHGIEQPEAYEIPKRLGLAEKASIYHHAQIDASALTDIITEVERFIAERKLQLAPEKKGEAIAIAYEMYMAGELNGGEQRKTGARATVARVLRLVA